MGKPSEMVARPGLLAPKATPMSIIRLLNRETIAIVQQPGLKKQLAADGGGPVGNTPEAFARWLKAKIAKWTHVVKEAIVSVE